MLKEAEFVLLGEEHGSVEIPELASALLGRIRPDGYRYLALEVGPLDADLLARLAAAGEPAQQVVAFRRESGTRFPFYSEYASDAALLRAVRTDSVALWGLDQEFIFGTPSQLARLAELAPNAQARSLVLGYHARDLAAAQADTGKTSEGRFLRTATDADFRALRAAFRTGSPDATRILDELEASGAIYRANFDGRGNTSNALRSQLMKRHLWAYYEAAVRADDAHPKVMFKLGALHAGRGLNALGVYDVGDAASELAELHGEMSFHIGFWSLDPDDVLLPVLRAVPAGAWAVVDLRPLRFVLARPDQMAAHPDLADLSRRFDAVVAAPHLTRSILLH
ncbi:MAG: hypothetical protein ACR2M1_08930 [Gemmatimonadaceae bacterium]